MPGFKKAPSLLYWSLSSLEILLRDGVLHCCDQIIANSKEDVVVGLSTRDKMEEIVSRVRTWIFEHVVQTMVDTVSSTIISGMEKAVELKKNSTNTNREMAIIVTFIDLITHKNLHKLDVADISKILRTNIYDQLNRFVGLRTLILGSGTGGWSNMYVEKFAMGIRTMKYLVKFSLCYDCTDSIVKILIQNCKGTLKILDLEMSKQVTDVSADIIAQASNIHTLQIFHTGMTESGHCSLLTKLKKLKVLVRGGFLCEALEFMEENYKHPPKLELEEFWSSEEYFFHDDQQMSLVQKYCPKMRKVMFQFSKEVMCDVLFLANFKNLTELHLWGGEFYSDKINLVLTQIGLQLKTLFLIHSEEINQQALISITKHCNNLNTLGLYNCDFNNVVLEIDEDESYFYYRRERDKDKLELMLELSNLSIVSECPTNFIFLLLSSALNIQHFKTGQNCALTDDDLVKLLEVNQLKHLESFQIPASKHLSMKSVELLLTYCEDIRSIQDLNYWELCNGEELEELRNAAKFNNYEIDLGFKPEERKIQKHLDDLNEETMNYLRGITED